MLLSENERETIKQFLNGFDLRSDGRLKTDFRDFKMTPNFLQSTYSSLKITYGDKNKEIILAIKVNNILLIF
jgi:exosome complex RNA-binding protein Rrp42 (RNase PH superfamily)